MYVFSFPLCLGDRFGNYLKPVFVVSIEADPALSVPYGNDRQFPGVFGKWYLYVVPNMLFQKGTFAYWSWSNGKVPRNLHMCGYLRQSDAYGFVVIILFQEGRSMNVAVSSVLTAAE